MYLSLFGGVSQNQFCNSVKFLINSKIGNLNIHRRLDLINFG